MQIDRYQIQAEIARGGFGAVYRAWDPQLQREVAIKVLLDPGDPDEIQRFLREGQAATRISHPNVLQVLGGGEEQGRPYLVLELVQGPTLAQRVERERGLLIPEALDLAIALASGVESAHQAGVLHRDLKPENVLFQEGRPLLTDFGIARIADARSLTQTGELLGTPGYMAPEQIQGDRERLGPATDVYGLGAILYATLTGGPPFQEATVLATLDKVLHASPRPPSALNAEVDRDLDSICLRALARDPSERYSSAREFGAALTAWATPTPAPARSEKGPLILTAALLVSLASLLTWALSSLPQLEPSPAPSASSPSLAPSPSVPPSARPSRSVAPPSPAPPQRSLLSQGRAALGRDLDEAARLFEAALLVPEQEPAARVELAFVQVLRRDVAAAARHLGRTVGSPALPAEFARYQYVAGRLFHIQEKPRRAQICFQRAHDTRPEPTYLAWLAIVSPSPQRQRIFNDLRGTGPASPALLYLEVLATPRRSFQQSADLAERIKAALVQAPASPYLALNLSRLYWYARQPDLALEQAREGYGSWASYPMAHLELGWIYAQIALQTRGPKRADWVDASQEAFQRGLRRFPGDVGLHRELAWLYCVAGLLGEGVRAHEELLEREAPRPSAWSLHNAVLAGEVYLKRAASTRFLYGVEEPRRAYDLAIRGLDAQAQAGHLRSREYGSTEAVESKTRSDLRLFLGRALGIQRRWAEARRVLDPEVASGNLLARYTRYVQIEEEAIHTLVPPAKSDLAPEWQALLSSGHAPAIGECLEARTIRGVALPPTQELDGLAARGQGLALRVQICRALTAKPYRGAEEARLRAEFVQALPLDLIGLARYLRLLIRLGQPERALAAVRGAPRNLRGEPLILALSGEALSLSAESTKDQIAARFAKAEEAFQRALSLEPRLDAARRGVLFHYLQQGDLRRAKALLEFLEAKLSAEEVRSARARLKELSGE